MPTSSTPLQRNRVSPSRIRILHAQDMWQAAPGPQSKTLSACPVSTFHTRMWLSRDVEAATAVCTAELEPPPHSGAGLTSLYAALTGAVRIGGHGDNTQLSLCIALDSGPQRGLDWGSAQTWCPLQSCCSASSGFLHGQHGITFLLPRPRARAGAALAQELTSLCMDPFSQETVCANTPFIHSSRQSALDGRTSRKAWVRQQDMIVPI
jgi:hypothetical protein